MRRWSAATVIAILAACSSPEKEAYKRLAKEVNPLLESIRPAAAKVLALPEDDHLAIISACTSVDEQLWNLRRVGIDEEVENLWGRGEASWTASILLYERALICHDFPADRVDECARWCRGLWSAMIEGVEKIRQAAENEGVHVVSLKPEQSR